MARCNSWWISSVSALLQSDRSPTGTPLSDEEVSWLASAPSLAAVISVSVFAFLVDRWGRKMCIVCLGVVQAICWIITLCPASTSSLVIARLFSGFGAGGGFNVVPMYVKEISESNIRGTLGMLLITSQNIGILSMYAMGACLEYYTVLYVVVGIPVVTALAMAIKAPESPTYLIKIGKEDAATSVLSSLRGLSVDDKRVQNEIDSIKNEDKQFKSVPNVSFVGIWKHTAWRNAFTCMIFIMIMHGMNGGFSIVNYSSNILVRLGTTVSPQLQSLSIPLVMITGSLVSMVCVDRLGRRLLLALSFMVSVVAFSVLAAVLLLLDGEVEVPGWVGICFVALAVGVYAAGVSPMPFIIMSEMFNFQIRAKVMGMLVTLGWFFAFIQLLTFGPITNNFGSHASFFCFGVINLVGCCLVLVCLPETKGKTVEEIDMELDKNLVKKVEIKAVTCNGIE